MLKKADVLEASKRELGRAINSNEYSKVSHHVIQSLTHLNFFPHGKGTSLIDFGSYATEIFWLRIFIVQ